MAIYDTMKMVKSPVSTLAVGFTGSMATTLLTAGSSGRRFALPNATIHMHPSSGGAKGYTEDVRIAYKEQERVQHMVFQVIAKYAKRSVEEIAAAFDNDHFMTASEARDFGLVDEVLHPDEAFLALPPTITPPYLTLNATTRSH
jgi:ATP-dependent Clp protease protease subunit